MKGICGIACDPNQDKYLSILEVKDSAVFPGKQYASKVEYRIDLNYTTNVYESCKQVVHPSSGRQAMELACGTEASKCNPDQWYFYMGDPAANPLVPFKIEYVNSEEPERRFTSETKNCDEAYDGSYACSCVDCAQSCPNAAPPEADDSGYMIFDLNGTTFIIAIVVGSLGIIALVFLSTNVSFRDLPPFFGGFQEMDIWLTRFFRWWGRSELKLIFNKIYFTRNGFQSALTTQFWFSPFHPGLLLG
jgi:Niemann-Pick C1 protein